MTDYPSFIYWVFTQKEAVYKWPWGSEQLHRNQGLQKKAMHSKHSLHVYKLAPTALLEMELRSSPWIAPHSQDGQGIPYCAQLLKHAHLFFKPRLAQDIRALSVLWLKILTEWAEMQYWYYFRNQKLYYTTILNTGSDLPVQYSLVTQETWETNSPSAAHHSRIELLSTAVRP